MTTCTFKQHINILIIALLLIPALSFAEAEPQKFDITIMITYKAMTLKEAAEKEKKARRVFDKGDIEIKLGDVCPVSPNNWNRFNLDVLGDQKIGIPNTWSFGE